MSKAVSVEYKGRVAIITLNKPEKLNAMTQADYFQITKYMLEVAEHDEVFITMLIGTGKFFSAYVFLSLFVPCSLLDFFFSSSCEL